MGLLGSYSALGSVALGPPDKMGSAVDILAKAGQRGRVPGLEARAGEIEPLRCWGRKRNSSAVGNSFTRTQRRLRGSQPWNTPTTTTHTHAVLNCDKRVLGLRHPPSPPGSRKSANGRPGGPSPGGVSVGGEVVQGGV